MVDADQVLLDMEVANSIVQFAKALEACLGYVNVLWMRNVLDVAEFNQQMLDIDIGRDDSAAEFLRGEAFESDSLDNVILAITPPDSILVFLELFFIMKVESVFLQLPSCCHVLQYSGVTPLTDLSIVRKIDR